MATITKADLRTRILKFLGIVAAGEQPSSEDAAEVESAIDSFHADLSKSCSPGFDSDLIPAYAQDAMRDCVAFRIAPAFGVPSSRISELVALYTAGWALLTRHASAPASGTTATNLRNQILRHLRVIRPGEVAPVALADQVDTAITQMLTQLQARDIVPFTSTTIPDWAMMPLRNYLAYLVAGSVGADPGMTSQLLLDHRQALIELQAQQQLRVYAPVVSEYL